MPARFPAPSVLLVEAHADTRDLYDIWLTQHGFRFTSAPSGADALAAVRAEAPDVIVAELMVPDGGISMLRALRAEPAAREALLIVLTTQASEALRREALDAGVDVYCVKPCGGARLGEVMAAASRDRVRRIEGGARDPRAEQPPPPAVLRAVRCATAIRERVGLRPLAGPFAAYDPGSRH